jgi:hypothetical protein
MNREQMNEARVDLKYMAGTYHQEDFRFVAIQTALTALDALLNAGEVFGEPLGKADEDIPDDKEEAYRLGSEDTRSEDTAILAKRMMGLEEVILREIDRYYMTDFQLRHRTLQKEIALAITQRLKGAK